MWSWKICGYSFREGGIPVAIDNSNAIDTSKKNLINYSNKILFIQADALNLPLKKECIDFAYSIGVLHHTPSPENGILEAFRVIKPGGELAVSVYSKKVIILFLQLIYGENFFNFCTQNLDIIDIYLF